MGREFQSLCLQMPAEDGTRDHEKDEEVHPGSYSSAYLQMAAMGRWWSDEQTAKHPEP